MKDHDVGFYISLDHSFESIPDAVPGFVFVETDQHVGRPCDVGKPAFSSLLIPVKILPRLSGCPARNKGFFG